MHNGAGHITIAPDLPPKLSSSLNPLGYHNKSTVVEKGPLRIVFLSRIAPMKNLDFALRVLSFARVPLEFHIYGPVSDSTYWQHCRELASRLPPYVHMTYHGAIPNEQVVETLSNYDLFFLPTRGENFGHVIVEALGSGIPVLISDRTPWQDIGAAGAGTVLPLSNEQAFVREIERVAALDPEARTRMRQAAFEYALRFAEDDRLVDMNRNLFLSVLA